MKGKEVLKLSKAGTLKHLRGKLVKAVVLPEFTFTVKEFQDNNNIIYNKINANLNSTKLIVRSSSLNEDNQEQSNAGHYSSILNVNSKSKTDLKRAIDSVINSYGEENTKNEIFVQPMVENIVRSGVAFTCDINTLAPYYVINYDESGSSESVTSGSSKDDKTYFHLKESPVNSRQPYINKLITCLNEIEILFDYPFLDIEFAFDKSEVLYVFQVRAISKKNKKDFSKIPLKNSLFKMYKKLQKLSGKHPNLLGNNAIYGVMPDWNPAEIIGLKPRMLASSLYKEIITDNIWAYQRDNYGYRNLRSHPLMILLLGIPFIDVRVDFNSFIPKSLDKKIGKKLVNYYLKKLNKNPVLHDKIEFEIVFSCYYFGIENKLNVLLNHDFSEQEIQKIKDSLLDITEKIMNPVSGLCQKDLEKINTLEASYYSILESTLPIIDKIYWLIEDCKRYGTLPFAGIARSAFIATQMLRSLVDSKVISLKDFEMFNSSIKTITRSIQNDLNKVKNEELTRDEFLKEYGHLRPGTYDILSPRYDENFDNYFSQFSLLETKNSKFKFSNEQYSKIQTLLKNIGLKISVDELISFIKKSIEGREHAKFIFTRSLSRILKLIEELGIKNNIPKSDLEFLNIGTILNLYSSLDFRDVKDILEAEIEKNKDSYNYTQAVILPNLILEPEDVFSFYLQADEPNFVTTESISSEIVTDKDIHKINLENKIVCIPSADPGYDFLFTNKIRGLITKFGGSNSYMAVRCAELNIPAIIGAGDKKYNLWSKQKSLFIDCLNKQVKNQPI